MGEAVAGPRAYHAGQAAAAAMTAPAQVTGGAATRGMERRHLRCFVAVAEAGRACPVDYTLEECTVSNGTPPIALAGSHLSDTRHVCAFFRSEDEEYEVLLPFIQDGFDCGDRAVHVLNPDARDGHLRRLTAAGIDTAVAEARGQLELHSNADTYLPDGRFDQDRMLEVFERLAGGDAELGFPRSRIVCRMDWAAAGGRALIDDVIEFESRVNDVWRRHDDIVVCTYHVRQLSGDAVIDVMRTHPMAIIGGALQRNPYFVPPERFAPDLRERRVEREVHHPPLS